MNLLKLVISLNVLVVVGAMAASKIDSLIVENNTVFFSTFANKSHTIPSCVEPQNQHLWSFSILTEEGKAKHTMLTTAISVGLKVNVESANDCGAATGIERVKSIWITQ